MLVLTRQSDEVILIAGSIRVTVLGVKGNQVRIGITAPPEVGIDREEVFRRREEFTERRERFFAEAG